MKLITVEKIKELENRANHLGLTYRKMMELAGKGIANIIIKRLPIGKNSVSIIGFVGSGNNGGDTLVALTHLAKAGFNVYSFCFNREVAKDELVISLQESGGKVNFLEKKILDNLINSNDIGSVVVLDGFLGTGFHPPISKEIKDFLDGFSRISRKKDWKIIAVDCPSGVDCSHGTINESVLKADMTICLAAVKDGLLKFPAFDYIGEIETVDIGLKTVLHDWDNDLPDVITKTMAEKLLPVRSDNSHKGTFGKVLVIGGSINYCGAVLLSATAAYRTGSGLVTVGTVEPVYSVIAGHLPEATWLLLPGDLGCISEGAIKIVDMEVGNYDAVLLGPGLGYNETTTKFMISYINNGIESEIKGMGFGAKGRTLKQNPIIKQIPLVIDADALKCLSGVKEWWTLIPSNSVITPHPGEMSILTGLSIEEIQENRLNTARKYAQLWGLTIVLKGALTVIADPIGGLAILPIASSALAHAGSGDVLGGMIAGYIGQGLKGYGASVLGCFLHATAALEAKDQIGSNEAVLSRDIIDKIAIAIKLLKNK